ncbi:CDP-alcohol phosphatidyltransferase family protein [Methanococcoides methylutens]|uniref:CDP-alcohol phosphatidyltransferase family protein n=1 Tax=Methanococcoides methylutens TaxID=2226 RepID=UPI000B1CC5B9|nr:CDP-alcohol phosphatidyltransferase family protein [Methanococcoides methylutens]
MPLAKNIPISPNILTIIGLLISGIAALEFAIGELIMGAAFIMLSGIFDVLDGAVARASGNITPFGGVLDSVCDRYADAIIFAGIIYGSVNGSIHQATLLQAPLWLWCVLALIGSYMVSYTRARAEAAGSTSMNVGVAERSERLIILILGAITGYILIAVAIIAVLAHFTLVQRIWNAKQTL